MSEGAVSEDRYFEDFVVGDIHRYGRFEVERGEVLDFARRYDAQPFHLDDAAAAKTHFGRLAASGWHTAAMSMAMIVDAGNLAGGGGSLGALGVDNLRWLKPVYPGDVLHATSEILEANPSRSTPGRGTVKLRTTVLNQDDEPVMRYEAITLWRTRPAG
ncbi:MaoC family dehydratase [Sphingomonas naphthae]|uniref:MaoC family dehydratase n=1 Tax=Sphingomonas naphthae TaxID=1813468 RepID=A0ABY7TQI2_9SPHN|nr:MaoC family dehydratase [Sphingomonas naphthae]WCT75278.1 MaoC family dehydratase [Sphingomonas naphthae]